MRGIAAGIGQNIKMITVQCAVGGQSHLRINMEGVTGARGKETLFAAQLHFHRNTAEFQGQPGGHRLFQHVLFITETAADIRLNHPDMRPRHIQRLAYHTAHNVRIWVLDTTEILLSASCRVAGDAFHMAVLNHRGIKMAAEPERRLTDCRSGAFRIDSGTFQQVTAAVDLRGICGQCRLR